MGELRSGSVSLAEILTYIQQNGQTGRLTIRQEQGPDPPAVLAFQGGHLVDARSGDEVGDDLVYRLLGQRGAAYSFDHDGSMLPDRTIAAWQEKLILATIGILPDSAPLPDLPAAAAPPVAAPAPPQATFHNAVPLPPGLPVVAVDIRAEGDFLTALERWERERWTGALDWAAGPLAGRLLLYQGRVIEAHWAEARARAVFSGEAAVVRFTNALLASPQARPALEIRALDPNFIWAYSALHGGLERPQDRHLTGVQWLILLERAGVRRLTGCVEVHAGEGLGYAFLCNGQVLGEYRPYGATLAEAPDWPAHLCGQVGSVVDVFTARDRADLPSLNHAAWPVERVAAALGQATLDVLGPRGQQVSRLLSGAGHDPNALRAACTRARQVTRIFIGAEEYEELSRRMDQLLAHLRS